MIEVLHKIIFYILMAKLIMTLYQRRYNDTGEKKRFASLYQSFLIAGLYAAVSGIKMKNLSDIFVYTALFISVAAAVLFRRKLFPYHLKCESCGKSLKLSKILFVDSQKCSLCEN